MEREIKINLYFLLLFLVGCEQQQLWNSPYNKTDLKKNIYFSAFASQPKTLDHAKSYTVDSNLFLSQIVEPPLQYDYFNMPYKIIPSAASSLPKITKLDTKFNMTNKHDAAYTLYDIYLRHDMYYAPHPAFVMHNHEMLYYPYKQSTIPNSIFQFKSLATKNATAKDFVYQIKRLASPKVNSPIYTVMAKHIDGMLEFNQAVSAWLKKHPEQLKADNFLDLRQFNIAGVKMIDDYHYQIRIKDDYPQFIYWLAMNFFAPTPWQVDAFYSQPGFAAHNLSFAWQPVGTGAYQLVDNNPNKVIRLTKNPNFRLEYFPEIKGLEKYQQRKLPLIDEFRFSLDKESMPRWYKFLQGFYDRSGINAHSFSSVVTIDAVGNFKLTPELQKKHLKLDSGVSPDIFFLGFNMQDPIVGGYSEQAKLLRQAISMVVDYEEFISIFMNGRGVVAQGPIPPTIFGGGKASGFNHLVYHVDNSKLVRNSIALAKQKLALAGYKNGIDPKTNMPLQLNYDVPVSGGPDDKARIVWMQEQFAKLGINLNIRATQYNRFQDKSLNGQLQIFNWGWVADYPDPENFLFLLYGPNAIVTTQGPNVTNYNNAKYNKLFEIMRDLPNGKRRQQIINQMLSIVRDDAPWVWGLHSKELSLSHSWVDNVRLNNFANNNLKYYYVDINKRYDALIKWNKAHTKWLWWGLVMLLVLATALSRQLTNKSNARLNFKREMADD